MDSGNSKIFTAFAEGLSASIGGKGKVICKFASVATAKPLFRNASVELYYKCGRKVEKLLEVHRVVRADEDEKSVLTMLETLVTMTFNVMDNIRKRVIDIDNGTE